MRVRLGGAVGLITVALLAACSGNAQPSTLPDTTPTGSTAPASEAVSPTPTADPTAQLEAEITEFLTQYANAINESWFSSAALARRREMFADSCMSCLAGYRLAEQAQADSLRLQAGKASLRDVQVDKVDGDIVTVSAFTDSQAGSLVDSNNNVVQEFDAAINTQIVFQIRAARQSSWVIVSGEVLD
jgi:hypothetical protein